MSWPVKAISVVFSDNPIYDNVWDIKYEIFLYSLYKRYEIFIIFHTNFVFLNMYESKISHPKKCEIKWITEKSAGNFLSDSVKSCLCQRKSYEFWIWNKTRNVLNNAVGVIAQWAMTNAPGTGRVAKAADTPYKVVQRWEREDWSRTSDFYRPALRHAPLRAIAFDLETFNVSRKYGRVTYWITLVNIKHSNLDLISNVTLYDLRWEFLF